MLKEIVALLKKDLLLEFRQRNALFSVLLFVVCTVYVAHLIFSSIRDVRTWNALFWVIVVFACIHTASKSFSHERENRFWYYYQLARPQALILSKIIYNTLLTWLVSLFTFILFSLFLGNVLKDQSHFILVIVLGTANFSSILTVVSAIASKTNNNITLMAVLSMPLLLPSVIIIVKASQLALMQMTVTQNASFLLALAALSALVCAMGYLLFPYLWRE
jgi:heme exporter protein B